MNSPLHCPSASRRVIISGGPGAGKTVLLEALAAAGHACQAEVSRQIIREQHEAGGKLMPWHDLPGFAVECERRMLAQLEKTTAAPLVFFDRGIPDIIAYLRHAGHVPAPRLFALTRAYTPLVLLAPPWEEIYRKDAERPQSYARSVELHAELVRTYRECGFDAVELPRASVRERVAFVETTMAASTALTP